MKRIIISIMAVLMLTANVYGGGWFVLTPCIDDSGRLVDKEEYKSVNNVEVKFKIVEIIEEILS